MYEIPVAWPAPATSTEKELFELPVCMRSRPLAEVEVSSKLMDGCEKNPSCYTSGKTCSVEHTHKLPEKTFVLGIF